ncbi:hypothetical protein BDV06DRAFT_218067 [Aspergillus oleicola]
MVYPSGFFGFIARKLRSRQVELESIIPEECSEECEDAGNIGDEDLKAKNGTNICAPDSALSIAFQDCEACCQRFCKVHNLTNQFIVPNYGRYLSVCKTDPDASASLLLASLSSVDASQTALQTSLADLGYNSSMPTTTTATAPASTMLAAESAGLGTTESASTSKTTSTNSRDLGVLIPAVVVPVVLIPLISLIAACLVMRRRRRRRLEYEQRAAGPSPFEGKAQLHRESFMPELDSATTTKSPMSPSPREIGIEELPAREPVEREMGASAIANGRET